MVANSTDSTTRAKRSTSKTSALTADQALEILQQSIINCQQSGIRIDLAEGGAGNTALVLAKVAIIDGRLVLENGE